jgi:hypothetical protein
MGEEGGSAWGEPPADDLQRGVVALLRGQVPGGSFDPGGITACLRRYECGGYLHARWAAEDGAARLPPPWAEAIATAHRKTAIDNLGALGEFRAVGRYLERESVPFVLLKGAAYLVDLYDDPGQRALTDLDLLIHHRDARRVARHLAAAGYEGCVDPWYPETQRFEMVRSTGSRSRVEFHWRLGLEPRVRIDQDAIWDRTRAARLEGVPCRLLGNEDAILFHVAHLADHYYGPTLKWILDLRAMLARWKPAAADLAARAAAWRVAVALHLALRHLEKLFPGEAPGELLRMTRPGGIRRRLLAPWLRGGPAELMEVSAGSMRRFLVRPLLLDSPWDALRVTAQVVRRPAARLARRLLAPKPLPWEPPA